MLGNICYTWFPWFSGLLPKNLVHYLVKSRIIREQLPAYLNYGGGIPRKWVGNQKVFKKRFGQHLMGRKCQLRLGRWSKKDTNLWMTPYELVSSLQRHFIVYQGRHGEFEPDKALYSTPNFFDWLFLIRAYWNPKSRQGPGLGGLASRGSPVRAYCTSPNAKCLNPRSNIGIFGWIFGWF